MHLRDQQRADNYSILAWKLEPKTEIPNNSDAFTVWPWKFTTT